MKNACKINDDGTVSILLNLRTGENLAVLISKTDYENYAEPFGGTWTAYQHQRTKKFYARGTYHNKETKRLEQPMLHRLIMKPSKGEITAHKDLDTLNCLRENMINLPIGTNIGEITAIEQATKREEKREALELKQLEATEKDNIDDAKQITLTPGPTGEAVIGEEPVDTNLQPLKGVSFHKVKHRWEVSLSHEGTRYRLGYWPPEELRLANNAVTKFKELGPVEYYKLYPKKER